MPIINFEKHQSKQTDNREVLDYLFYLDVIDQKQTLTDYFLPNGRFELVVDLADRVRYLHADGQWHERPRISLRAQHTAALRVACSGPRYESIGAVFSLGKISSLIPDTASRQYGTVIDLEDIFPGSSDRLFTALKMFSDVGKKISILDQFISEKLSTINPQPPFVDHSLLLMLQCQGQITVGDLSKRVRCSTRHLRRTFIQHVGISPKLLCSILRLYDTSSRISRLNLPMSDVISDNGYFDRAHFYKDFIKIAGIAPSEFFNSPRFLSRHFFNTAVASPISTPVYSS